MTAATEITQNRVSTRRQADLALVLVCLIWGITFVVVKRALGEISTMFFLAIRFSLASVCLLLMFLPRLRAGSGVFWSGLKGGMAAGVFLWLG